MTMKALKRSDFSTIRTKCMVRPYQVFEAGIHHISKPIWADLDVHKVDPGLAYLHHYRGCVGNMGMNCMGSTDDKTMLRYRDRLGAAFVESWQQLASLL
jgi:hypothetical protein